MIGTQLYFNPISQPSRAVHALLIANNIPFEPIVLNGLKGETRTPEFLKINPAGQIPVLRQGDFILPESHAILRYICNSEKVEEHWYPKDPKERARVDWYLDWHHFTTRRIQKWMLASLGPKIGLDTKDIDKEAEVKKIVEVLERIEEDLLEKGDYIASKDKPTIADLSAYSEMVQLEEIGYDLSKYPKVSEWLKRVGKIEAVEKVHEPFRALAASLKSKPDSDKP